MTLVEDLCTRATLAAEAGLLLAAVDPTGRQPVGETLGHLLGVDGLQDVNSRCVQLIHFDVSLAMRQSFA